MFDHVAPRSSEYFHTNCPKMSALKSGDGGSDGVCETLPVFWIQYLQMCSAVQECTRGRLLRATVTRDMSMQGQVLCAVKRLPAPRCLATRSRRRQQHETASQVCVNTACETVHADRRAHIVVLSVARWSDVRSIDIDNKQASIEAEHVLE